MTIGEAVRRLREQRGWNQQKLADLTRLDFQGTIANIESNKHPYPRLDTLLRLAAAFDVSLDELLHGVQNPDGNPPAAGAATPSEAGRMGVFWRKSRR